MGVESSILRRGMARLRQAWNELGSALLNAERLAIDPSFRDEAAARMRRAIAECLEAPGSDYARRTRAGRIGQAYLLLDEGGRERFLRLLGREYDADEQVVRAAIADFQRVDPDSDAASRRHRLRQALVAPRTQLLTLFNALPDGIHFLVNMRADLLALGARRDPELAGFEQDLRFLLASWFDIGFLQLRRLDWNTPAAFLEKLIEHEAVHAISGWTDLKNRLASDRRLFAFVHPNMPDEPLIFVQVALCRELATSVQALLDIEASTIAPAEAGTAIFYSISNAQRGLDGISLGNYLIRRVVAELRRELPGLRQFATLSPVPGFASWLQDGIGRGIEVRLSQREREQLAQCAAARGVAPEPAALLAQDGWHSDAAVASCLKPALLRLCARYLTASVPEKPRALDPVAHFHLGNGATMHQLDWMADTSAKGLAQSFGIMVNYLYDVRRIDADSEAYALHGTIAASAAVRELLR